MFKAVQIMASTSSSYALSNRLIKPPPPPLAPFLLSSSRTRSSSSPRPPHPPTTHNIARRFLILRMCSTRSDPHSHVASHSNVAAPDLGNPRKINFCQWCGGATKHEVPDGEEKMRAICTLCGRIAYQNPKMVVGCLIEHENKILLCKRKIQPSYGLWTLPAGYLEIGESAVQGAMRETQEEAGAEVDVLSPFAHLDIPLIGQAYVIFLAKLKKPQFSPGPESIECRLFSLEDIPFDSLAFSSMLVTLKLYIEDMKAGRLRFHYGLEQALLIFMPILLMTIYSHDEMNFILKLNSRKLQPELRFRFVWSYGLFYQENLSTVGSYVQVSMHQPERLLVPWTSLPLMCINLDHEKTERAAHFSCRVHQVKSRGLCANAKS
ncbi:hypothetical protein Droror1_Dr00009299 [Drosera rotundifolia]